MANPYQAPLEDNEVASAPRRSFGLAGCGCAAVFVVVAIAFASLWSVARVDAPIKAPAPVVAPMPPNPMPQSPAP